MEHWTARHFSLANARNDAAATDLAALLRRMADETDKLGIEPEAILDLTVSSEATADGPWWSATLYWSDGEKPRSRSRQAET